jgi:hypothetical protein
VPSLTFCSWLSLAAALAPVTCHRVSHGTRMIVALVFVSSYADRTALEFYLAYPMMVTVGIV